MWICANEIEWPYSTLPWAIPPTGPPSLRPPSAPLHLSCITSTLLGTAYLPSAVASLVGTTPCIGPAPSSMVQMCLTTHLWQHWAGVRDLCLPSIVLGLHPKTLTMCCKSHWERQYTLAVVKFKMGCILYSVKCLWTSSSFLQVNTELQTGFSE